MKQTPETPADQMPDYEKEYLQKNPALKQILDSLEGEQLLALQETIKKAAESERKDELIEKLNQRIEFLMYDQKTKLLRRELYFEVLEEKLAQLSDEELSDKGQRLFVTVYDLAHLGYFNLSRIGGHAAGDFVLQQVGTQIRERHEPSQSFRTGGDEFATIQEGDYLQVSENNQMIRGALEAIELEFADPEAKIRVDYGIAHISEGYEALKTYCDPEKNPAAAAEEKCKAENRNNQVAEFCMDIADRRAFIRKAYYGINDLLEKRKSVTEKQMEVWIDVMKKGTGINSVEVLDAFAAISDNAEQKVAILEHIKKHVESAKKEEESLFLEKQRIISEIADEDEFKRLEEIE